MKTIRHRLDDDALIPVCDDPVELCRRQLLAERGLQKSKCRELRPRIVDRCTLREDPRDKFELRDLIGLCWHIREGILIDRIAHEIKTCHAEALFVHAIIVKRIAASHEGHADDRVVRLQLAGVAEPERIVSRRDRHLFTIGKLIIQRSADVKILRLIGCCCTHCLFKLLSSMFINIRSMKRRLRSARAARVRPGWINHLRSGSG